jgi:HK97 family phage prohead protease
MENNNILETRFATELRADEATGVIQGTAIVFNSESVLMGGQFKEIILPEAASADFMRSQPDIVMRYQHNPDSILARFRAGGQRNSLNFNVDNRGVHFSFKAKAKDAGLIESINSGDLNGASFTFKVSPEPNSEKWEKRNDGTYLRTIKTFDIVNDFSIVINPAYQATQVNVRGLDELKQAEELQKQKDEENRQKTEADKVKVEQDKEKNISEYYKKYDSILSNLKK